MTCPECGGNQFEIYYDSEAPNPGSRFTGAEVSKCLRCGEAIYSYSHRKSSMNRSDRENSGV